MRVWLPENMTITQAVKELQVSRVSLSKVLNGKSGITAAGMALRLLAWLNTSAEVRLNMKIQSNLWQAEPPPRPRIKPLAKDAA